MEELEDGTTWYELHRGSHDGGASVESDTSGEDAGFAELPFHDQPRFAPGLRTPECAPVFRYSPFLELLTRFEAADEVHAEEPNEQNALTLKNVSWELRRLATDYDATLMALQDWWQVLKPIIEENVNSWVTFTRKLAEGDRSPALAAGLHVPEISNQDRNAFSSIWQRLDGEFRRSIAPYSEDMGELSMWDAAHACAVRAEYIQRWSEDENGSRDDRARYFLSIYPRPSRHLVAFEAFVTNTAMIRSALIAVDKYLAFYPLAHLGDTGPSS